MKLTGDEIQKVLGPLYATRWAIELERRQIRDSIESFHETTDYAYKYRDAPKSDELESLYTKSLDAEKRYNSASKQISDYIDYLDDPEDEVVEIDKELSEAASAMGKLGGSKKSEAKSASSRANGKLGGRPKKVKDA